MLPVNSSTVKVNLPDDLLAELSEYCQHFGIKRNVALHVALSRMLALDGDWQKYRHPRPVTGVTGDQIQLFDK